jgi:polyvinyl alcohol dehydrogenase (cytochrome)
MRLSARFAFALLAATAVVVLAGVMPAARAADPAPGAYRAPEMRAPVKLDAATLKRGAEIYDQVCSKCHEAGLARAPQRFMLQQMTPESIRHALTDGVMRPMAEGLTASDLTMIAEYIAGRSMGGAVTPPLMCAAGDSTFDVGEPPPFAGWGLTARGAHAIPTATAGLDRTNVGKLTLKWTLSFPNAIQARSQPTVAAGAIFVGSHDGSVFALDRATGCARWVFHALSEVRTGIVVSPWRAGDASAQPRVYFGDLIGNVYAVKARTGELVWKRRPDSHPNATITATPVLRAGRVYVAVSSLEEARTIDPHYECCSFRGSVVALNAMSGARLWQTYMTDRPTPRGVNASGARRLGPSGVALWDSPVIDTKRGRLYVATGDNYSAPPSPYSDAIVALDLKTGKIAWAYQAQAKDAWNVACGAPDRTNCPKENGPDFDFGAGAVLATASNGRDYVLAGQKSGVLYAVNPDTGKLVWKVHVGRGGVKGGIHFGIAVVGDTVLAPVSDVPDGRTYADAARPGMYALDVKTGAYLWKAPSEDVCAGKPFCHPGYGAAITATPELVIAGANDGHLRIYDTATGAVLWDYDTLREFTTVNGAPAHGGSIGGGAAPIAYKGMLVANAGYGFAGALPGNALLVFEAK